MTSAEAISPPHSQIPLTRGMLQVSGPERRRFLQGLLTQNIETLQPGQLAYALLLTPQGKFLHELFVLDMKDTLLLDCDAARRDDLLARLRRYKLRTDVTLEDVTEAWQVAALPAGDSAPDATPPGIFCAPDPRLPALGVRVYLAVAMQQDWRQACALPAASEAQYHAWRIECAVPDGSDMLPEQSLPLEFGMDRLQAIDFSKGCYVGQEVTARTKHRANLRKGIYRVSADTTSLPPHGTDILLNEKTIGMMLGSLGSSGLALLKHEALTHGSQPFANDIPLQYAAPQWRAAKT